MGCINLEDRVESFAGEVLRRGKSSEVISRQISKATDDLRGHPSSDGTGWAIEWLAASGMALEERNRVLRSIPSNYPDGRAVLVHIARKAGAVSETLFEADVLQVIAERLEGLVRQWRDVAVAHWTLEYELSGAQEDSASTL